MKIKFKLVKFEKALAFQILEMNEQFRCEKVKLAKLFYGHVFEIRAVNTLELNGDIIYLRGEKVEDDNKIVILKCGTNQYRDKYHDDMLIDLKDWAENWEGWKEEKEEIKTDESNVFEF